jgi:hypothetical protein
VTSKEAKETLLTILEGSPSAPPWGLIRTMWMEILRAELKEMCDPRQFAARDDIDRMDKLEAFLKRRADHGKVLLSTENAAIYSTRGTAPGAAYKGYDTLREAIDAELNNDPTEGR